MSKLKERDWLSEQVQIPYQTIRDIVHFIRGKERQLEIAKIIEINKELFLDEMMPAVLKLFLKWVGEHPEIPSSDLINYIRPVHKVIESIRHNNFFAQLKVWKQLQGEKSFM